ncbi:TolC family protein [Glacieibacterium frigidum]
MIFVMRRASIALATLAWSGVASAAPVTLIDALTRADASPRLAAAREQLEAATARARQARVSVNPEVGLTFENLGGTGPYRDFRSTETTLEVSQRLEMGGKRSARVRVARGEVEVARLGLVRTRADIARDVRDAHAALAAAEARLTLADDVIRSARELVRTMGLLVDTGKEPPLRKLRADALLSDATATRAAAEGELSTAQRALAALSGVDSEGLYAVQSQDERPPLAPIDSPGIGERIAAAERDAARARIDLARSDGVPDPVLGGGFRRFSETRNTAFVARVSIPLPIRNRNTDTIAAVRSDSLVADANLAQVRIDAMRARRDAAARLAAADGRLAALGGAGQVQAEEALRIARRGYQAGKFTLIELIDAQTAYNTTRGALIDARLDRARALAALFRADAREEN